MFYNQNCEENIARVRFAELRQLRREHPRTKGYKINPARLRFAKPRPPRREPSRKKGHKKPPVESASRNPGHSDENQATRGHGYKSVRHPAHSRSRFGLVRHPAARDAGRGEGSVRHPAARDAGGGEGSAIIHPHTYAQRKTHTVEDWWEWATGPALRMWEMASNHN